MSNSQSSSGIIYFAAAALLAGAGGGGLWFYQAGTASIEQEQKAKEELLVQEKPSTVAIPEVPVVPEATAETEATPPPPSMTIPSKGMKFQVEVSQTIKTAGGDLRSCLEPYQGEIKVTLLLNFGTSGFEHVELESADELSETVAPCMNKALMAYAWPASSDDPVQIKMPMIFSFE